MYNVIHRRRTRPDDLSPSKVVENEEVHLYFTSEHEWKLASNIYWERHALRRPSRYFLDKLNLEVSYYNYLMTQYAKFMLHEYEIK